MNNYFRPILILLTILTLSACKKKKPIDSEIESIHNRAKQNHQTSRDSLDFYLASCLEYDTLQMSDLSRARIQHIKGLYYESQLKYDSAAITFAYGASLLGNNELKATLLLCTAINAVEIQDYEWYRQTMAKAEKLIKKLNNPIYEAKYQGNKGNYNVGIGNFEKAIPYFLAADSILKSNNIVKFRDYYQNRLGLSYRKLSKYPQAFEHIKRSIDLSTQSNNTFRLSYNLIDISRMYRTAQRYDEALEWEEKHLELAQKNKSLRQIQKGLENMGIIYAEKKEWDQAESYFLKSLDTALEMDDPSSIGDAISNTGNFYYRQGNLDKALKYYKQAYQYRLKHYNKPGSILSSLFHLGDVDLEKQKYKSSEAYLQRAIFLADSTNQIGWAATIGKRLIDLYEKTGDYKKQVGALQHYIEVNKQWHKNIQNTSFNKLTIQYEAKQKETTIALQTEQLKNNRQLLIIISISFLLLLSITIAFFVNKKNRFRAFRAIYRQQLLVNDQQKVISSLLKKSDSTGPTNPESKLLSGLTDLLENQEIYKNPEASLELVAKELGTNITYVSKLVNNEYNCNFNTLIKRYRIDFCKECLKESDGNIPMKNIGLRAGFKSQSTFYATFKDFVGMTPLQFAKISQSEKKQPRTKIYA